MKKAWDENLTLIAGTLKQAQEETKNAWMEKSCNKEDLTLASPL